MNPQNPSEWRPTETPRPASEPPRRFPRGGLSATLLAVALFGALIGFAADRWAVGNFSQNPLGSAVPTVTTTGPRTGPVAAPNGGTTAQAAPTTTTTTSTTPPPAATATDPTQLAIQQVIQRGDEEQAQALASNDPTVMQDTSTSDFYQTQVATNQDLRSNGVSDIKLANIEWGSISVNGTSATATAFETWITTYTDGTTEQSRDRNVYTLVQQNGNWVISADEHPDDLTSVGVPGVTVPGATVPGQGNGQPGPTGPGRRGNGQPGVTVPDPATGQPGVTVPLPGTGQPGAQPGLPPRPRVSTGQSVSQNWSGYAATGGTYTAVSGTWTVPQFTPDSTAGADAAWVGIGGVNSRDLIQAGTQQTVSGSGSTQYQAWVETLPQASHPVPLTVNPGDSVTVSITQLPQGQDQWQIAFKNNTTGQSYQVTEHYASSMSSAEWIEEAPSAARGRQLPLDNFGSVTFTQGSAVKNGQTVNIAASGAQPITMVSRANRQSAQPSALTADGSGFTVTEG